jgi:hypothetical protein
MARLDLEVQRHELRKRVCQPRRDELVAHLAAFPGRADQPAPAQAGQVVRDVRAPDLDVLGQLRGIGRPVEKAREDGSPGRVSQRRRAPAASAVGAASASPGIGQLSGPCQTGERRALATEPAGTPSPRQRAPSSLAARQCGLMIDARPRRTGRVGRCDPRYDTGAREGGLCGHVIGHHRSRALGGIRHPRSGASGCSHGCASVPAGWGAAGRCRWRR